MSKLAAMFITGFAIAFLIFYSPETPTIEGHSVSADLHCTEEEVIWFDKSSDLVPRPLACIHADYVTE